MTSLHLLVTALVRLLGLHFVIRAVESAASPLFSIIMQLSTIPDDTQTPFPNPWVMFLPMVGFYVILAAVIFFAAPRISRMIVGSHSGENAEVPWQDTLIFCTGGLIVAWAFVRLTDTVYRIVASAEGTDGQYAMDNAMMVYLFMTAALLGGGFLLIAKFHRVSAWLATRRAGSEQNATGQPATSPESR
jgi:hypothetical protein